MINTTAKYSLFYNIFVKITILLFFSATVKSVAVKEIAW